MKVLILDNYDSFTYNLFQLVGEILMVGDYSSSERSESRSFRDNGSRQARTISNFKIDVLRNDDMSLAEIRKRKYDRIIISPGPGTPGDPAYFGVCGEVLLELGKITPVLGVCLGMQGMAHFFGGKIVRADKPMHGKTSLIKHDGKGVFRGLPQDLEVMRYHSLVADPGSLPRCLEVSAVVNVDPRAAHSKPKPHPNPLLLGEGNQGDVFMEIMGLRHKEFPVEGIQFHPESFATEGGKKILENFLIRVKGKEN